MCPHSHVLQHKLVPTCHAITHKHRSCVAFSQSSVTMPHFFSQSFTLSFWFYLCFPISNYLNWNMFKPYWNDVCVCGREIKINRAGSCVQKWQVCYSSLIIHRSGVGVKQLFWADGLYLKCLGNIIGSTWSLAGPRRDSASRALSPASWFCPVVCDLIVHLK